jgi:hypothetical protein
MKPSAISGSTSMMRSAIRPCAISCTFAAASELGGAGQAVDLARVLVEPVLEIFDAVLGLDLHVRVVGLRDVSGLAF